MVCGLLRVIDPDHILPAATVISSHLLTFDGALILSIAKLKIHVNDVVYPPPPCVVVHVHQLKLPHAGR